MLCLVAKELKTSHHFTFPFSMWRNRAVEFLGKEHVRKVCALLSQWKVCPGEWPIFFGLVKSTFNNALSSQRGDAALLTDFSGQELTSPVEKFLRSKKIAPIAFTKVQIDTVLIIKQFETIDMRPGSVSFDSLQDVTGGYYVIVVAREDLTAGEKYLLRWRGLDGLDGLYDCFRTVSFKLKMYKTAYIRTSMDPNASSIRTGTSTIKS